MLRVSLLLLVFLSTTSWTSCGVAHSVRKSNWMKTCPGMAKLSLAEFCFPGTHDSGAFQRPDFSVVAGDSSLAKSALLSVPAIRNIATKWSVAQPGADVYKQLMNGVRFLDFRVSYAPVSERSAKHRYYLVHTFAMSILDNGLRQIRKFLSENPSEVILLSLSGYYKVNTRKLQRFVSRFLGELLYQGTDGKLNLSVTLDDLRQQGKQAIVTLNNDEHKLHTSDLEPGYFLSANVIYSPQFHGKATVKSKLMDNLKNLREFLDHGHHGKLLFLLPYTLTEGVQDVTRSIFTHGSLRRLAGKINPTQKAFVFHLLSKSERNAINIITNDDQKNSDNVFIAMRLIAERVAAKGG